MVKFNMNTIGITFCLTVYGITHAMVDAACIMLLVGGIDVRDDLVAIIYSLVKRCNSQS